MQRVAVDAQAVGGLGLDVVAGGHDLGDQFALDTVDDFRVQGVFLRSGGREALVDQLAGERLEVGGAKPAAPRPRLPEHRRR